MHLNCSKTLWSNHDRTRFFLIPDDRELPGGDFELKTITGRQQHTLENAVIEFEISRDRGMATIRYCYPLFASFVTIPDAQKAFNSNGFSVSPGKSRWVLGMVLAKFGNESTKLVEDELN